jgi:hypothetical protein
MRQLERRLRRLEAAPGDGGWVVVKQYPGMTRDEAMLLRFGPEGRPSHVNIILIIGYLPAVPDDVPLKYRWAWKPRTPEDEATWAALAP